MRIIDAHAHIFPDKIAVKASASIGQFYGVDMDSDASSNSLLEKEREIGAERILVCSSALSEQQVESINDFIHDQCVKHSEFVGLAAMHKDYANYAEELDRVLELGLHGVKFHNDMQRFDIDDPKMFPIYRAMADRKMIVLFHMGDDRYDYSAPKRMCRIAWEFEDLTIIGAHFGGYQRWEESFGIPRLPNVYYDTSSSLPFMGKDMSMPLRLIDRFGPEHFFFGSDFPMWSPKKELERFMNLGLDEGTNRMILYDNFARVFKLV